MNKLLGILLESVLGLLSTAMIVVVVLLLIFLGSSL